MYEIPPILRGTPQEQLNALRDYLVRLTFEMNREQTGAETAVGTAEKKPGAVQKLAELIAGLQQLALTVWPIKFRPGGTGVSIGKAATEDNALELPNGWSIILHGPNGETAALSYAQLRDLLDLL